MFEEAFITFDETHDYLKLRGLPILVDPNDHAGIHIAVENLSNDLEKVTGHKPAVWTNIDQTPVTGVILVGSLEKSLFIQKLVKDNTYAVDRMIGKWETFQTSIEDSPWPAAEKLFVIAGSDKRGTIFGVYTLCEQLGVSPWYWWADVPIQRRNQVYALPVTTIHGPPSVQYRGIFINDETPALTDWVHEKFGPRYNSAFYSKVFELLLRMKANFLWPAMWSGFPEPGSIFFTDDPLNQELADRHGIVISTSHHEPMQRNMSEWRQAKKGKWNWAENKPAIAQFFREGAERARPFESILTLGMRGESDGEIDATDPKATLTDILDAQRSIIREVYGESAGVNQVMALYKEVQGYFEEGLAIPDDVTILFADDNFGNIRRLPSSEERKRPGGFGIYYHLEYVGNPRSYKWLNTNSCGMKFKIHHQLQIAYKNGVSKLWVFNVGDIKPQEMPLTFAMAFAWNVNAINHATITNFLDTYSAREFGHEQSTSISELLLEHGRLMALRRHEHIEVDTFSILNYREAEKIEERYHDLDRKAQGLLESLPEPFKPAFFQLVLHPIRASRINTQLRITQAKNQLFGHQRRNTTNVMAQKVLDLFEADYQLSEEYHNSPWTGNKWNHMMKQPHYGFSLDTWEAPSRDMITGLTFVQRRQNSNRIMGQMGVAVEGHTGIRPGLINEESDRMQPSRGELTSGLTMPPLSYYGYPSRYFEIFTRGTEDIDWSATPKHDWILLSCYSGQILLEEENDCRVEVTIDWEKVPAHFHDMVSIEVRSRQGDYEQVHVQVINHRVPNKFQGFVESDGHIAIDAGAITLKNNTRFYKLLPYIGRTSSGGLSLAESYQPSMPDITCPVFFFTDPIEVKVELYFTMTLAYQTEEFLGYDIGFDYHNQESVPLLQSQSKADLPEGWSSAVQDGVWVRKHTFPYASQGEHLLRYRPRAAGLVLEKIIIDLGGVRPSYLGPPMSQYVGLDVSSSILN